MRTLGKSSRNGTSSSRCSSCIRRNLVLPLLASIAVLGCPIDQKNPKSQRIVLITLDTLRYDAAFTEQAETTMPNLRSWAKSATVFERFYSASASTQPSHASILTGLHPWEHGVTTNGTNLSTDFPTVPEKLQAAGFSTTAIVASFPLAARFGFNRGFDHFDDSFNEGIVRGEWLRAAPDFSESNPPPPFYSLSESIEHRALESLHAPAKDRQFFWFHFLTPTAPMETRSVKKTHHPQVPFYR